MASDVQTDLSGFYVFIGKQVEANPASKLSLEDALNLWRHRQVENEAIREGLADIAAGRTRPVEEFITDFEQRHGLRDQT